MSTNRRLSVATRFTNRKIPFPAQRRRAQRWGLPRRRRDHVHHRDRPRRHHRLRLQHLGGDAGLAWASTVKRFWWFSPPVGGGW